MSDREAFLANIRAKPDDDAPRLVFADWLDEQGEHERAEYIRVQCERAGLPAEHPLQAELQQREAELYEQHFDRLAAEIPDWCSACEFQRGFLHTVHVKASDLVAQAADLWRVAFPSRVVISEAAGQGAAIAQVPELAEVARLEFTDSAWLEPDLAVLLASEERTGMTDHDMIAIAASRHLSNLRALRVAPYHQLSSLGVIAILNGPWRRLEALELPGQHGGDEAAEMLRRVPSYKHLHTLDLSMARMTSRAALSLTQAGHLHSVRQLKLAFNDFLEAGAAILAGSPTFARVEELSLAANEIGDAGFASLVQSPHLKNLRVLDVSANAFLFGMHPTIGPDGIQALTESPNMQYLHTLAMRHNPLAARGGQLLAEATNMPALRTLDLSSCQIGAGLRALAKGPLMRQLRSLSLGYNDLSDAHVKQLAKSKETGELRVLQLDGNGLSCEAVEALAHALHLSNLTHLSLYNNRIRATGANALARSKRLPALRTVGLGSNPIRKATENRLRKLRPNVFEF